MLALIVHPEKKPDLGKGTLLVPLARWEDSKIPLRILREEARAAGRMPDDFMTLVKIPDAQRVAVIVGRPPQNKDGFVFIPLGALAQEDREIVDRSLEMFRNPTQGDLGVTWLARLVLGERLPSSAVKRTQDLRLLQQGAKNATTKRT